MDYEFTDLEVEARTGLRRTLGHVDPGPAGAPPDAEPADTGSVVASVVADGWLDAFRAATSPLSLPGRLALAEELGAVLAPMPWVEIAGAVLPVLESLGADDRVEEVVAGRLSTAWTDWRTPPPSLVVRESGGAVEVSGRLEGINLSGDPGHLLVPGGPGCPAAMLVPLAGAGVEVRVSEDDADLAGRRGTVVLERCPIPADLVWRAEDQTTAAIHRDAWRLMSLYAAAGAVGGAARLLEKSISYAVVREQFGTPIGRFQAVKHLIADLATDVENVRTQVYVAGSRLGEADAVAVDRDVAAARLMSIETYIRSGERAIQVHGGMGFTWEAGLHRWYRRAVADGIRADRDRLRAVVLAGW